MTLKTEIAAKVSLKTPELQTSRLDGYEFRVIIMGWSCPEIGHSKTLYCVIKKQIPSEVRTTSQGLTIGYPVIILVVIVSAENIL